ncbi:MULTISPECIES: acetate/propionate family kinase [unclassified Dietzia]|uniref:acetate/propionate family kinase n=1 Tax=unclassified Dietzia TaxID=2617939 RepID=UPI0015FAD44F|nr:acetate kinase [Dietzia sp. Cai40]MBB1044327.1 acetate kinase [Dietzia sp. DQ11-44]MBC7296455.1 acetate kinase [Dietzia sp.]
MTRVLVINSGSSSLKLSILDTAMESELAWALVERIGEPVGTLTVRRGDLAGSPGEERTAEAAFPDHTAALSRVLELAGELGAHPTDLGVEAIGHRVVHGGPDFHDPVEVTPEVEAGIERLELLAPLHNPANLRGIRVARELLPGLPHVAVFDTGFFHTLPAAAHTYAIDRAVASEWDLRRYGFHGTSHEFVSRRTAEILGRPYDELNQIVLHLGNGASASAISGGRAVDTSMGLTPLEGLVMGTRPGDLDPGLIIHLIRDRGMSPEDVSTLLNRRSGLEGLAGARDFRELLARVDAGDDDAVLAYEVVIHRLRRYIGGYWAVLGDVGAITFTAGVGENVARLRADALSTLGGWGVEIDPEANENGSGERIISTPGSRVTVLVVPTDEELAIARACDTVLGLGE